MKLYLFLITIIFLAVSPVMAEKYEKDPLVLRGKVQDIKDVSKDPQFVDLEVGVDIEFINTGIKPIIFLKPQKKIEADLYWPGAISLSLEKFLAERGGRDSSIWVQALLPSVNTSPIFKEIVKRLDQPTPPAELTQILQPKESWTWQTTAFLRFYTKPNSSNFSAHDLSWQVIGKIVTPLWMKLNYEVWSYNLQRADKGLRKRLQKRWANIGILNIEASLGTEPIELNLNNINKVND